MQFKTKAQNLSNIKLKNAKIPKLYFFKVKEYTANKLKIINQIQKKFKTKIAIRSSSAKEDGINLSNAGMFESFLNVNISDKTEIQNYIDKVIKSYGKINHINNEVLIQEMVKKPLISGVATSCDKDTYSPYYHINFTESKDTSLVTSGKNGSKSFVFFKYSEKKPNNFFLKKVISLIFELEKKFRYEFIDIEFILDQNKILNLVQIRPVSKKKKNLRKIDYLNHLKKLEKKIKKLKIPHHDLFGKKTAFGVMPDWNPAEIIGIKPKPLALSLYQELITNKIWAEQRKDYGYIDVRSNQLMANFFGTPYVDVRVDFNSWIPNSLEKKISEKLVNFYINKFAKNKLLHDKVEFEILFTCYTPSSSKKINYVLKNNFSKEEINKIILALKKINILSTKNFLSELNKLKKLENKQKKIKDSKMYFIDKIYWLVEDCKRYGTLPFAGLARNAFIATEILNSLVNENIISKEKSNNFLSEIKSITSEIYDDWKNLSKKLFLKRHGHLRPNTYEITSKNYKSGHSIYFSKSLNKDAVTHLKNKKVFFTNNEKKKINIFLKKFKSDLNFDQFIRYLKESIKMREYSKHIFTKSIDLLFENIMALCNRFDLSHKDASFLNINKITELYYNLSSQNIEEIFKEEIKKNKKQYKINYNFKLPETIINENDIYFYYENQNKINFVGDKIITSDVISLENTNININKIRNKIVCIESADPGYDFIFFAKIKGLITKYGGVNSHMSVRCSELGLPAAIGVGESQFNNIISSKKIELDCQAKTINFLR